MYCLCVLILMPAPTSNAADSEVDRVVFILDGSNSMWGRIDGTEKIVVARDVLGNVLSDIPSDMQVGLAAYGHRRKGACDDIETILPVGDHSQSEMEDAIRSVQPTGMTPITAALEHVAEEFEDQPGKTQIVLVSDGKETCNRDPCAAVSALRDQGINLTVHVVGFDVTGEESEQLQCIAEAGGGRYAGAGTALELTTALAEIKQTVVEDVVTPPSDPDEAHWRLEAGNEVYEGKFAILERNNGKLVLELFNDDAVNFALHVPNDDATERSVDYAFFAVERGPTCELVASEPPFQVRFDKGVDDRLGGTFSGVLACPDYSALDVSGLFTIPDEGGEQ